MATPFENLPWFERNRLIKEAARRAEWNVPDGPAGDLVRQMRCRAYRANAWTNLILLALAFTILIGLLFFVGGPLWRQNLDSERRVWGGELAVLASQDAALNGDRKRVQDGLVAALKGSAEVIPSGINDVLGNSIVTGQTILLFGGNIFNGGAAITRSTDGGASFTAIDPGTDQLLRNGIVAGQTILLFGGNAFVRDGGDSAIIRSTDGGASFTAIPSSADQPLWNGIVAGQTILLFGEGGTIIRSTDGGASFTAIASGTDQTLGNSVVAGQTILLFGEGGAIVRSTDGGASFTAIPSGTDQTLGNSVVAGQTILLFGGNLLERRNAITRSTDGGASFTAIRAGTDQVLWNGIVAGQTILLFGAGGTIIRSTDGGASFTAIPSGTDQSLGNGVVAGQTILLFGGGGAITRSTDSGASFTAIPSSTDQILRNSVAAGQTILLIGDGGAIVRLSDTWSEKAGKLILAEGAAGDRVLLEFIDKALPTHLQSWQPVMDFRQKLLDIISRRDFIAAKRGEIKGKLIDRASSAPAVLFRDRIREQFTTFMSTCRSGKPPGETTLTTSDKGDALTVACLEGWKAQVASDDGTWWQTLANQVPPGILLLFLLAVLSGLYRYNLRMAGFHHSRADALLLLAQGHSKEDIENFTRISDALAADKVEFGKDNSPADQAVEIFKAFVSRTKE